MASGEGRGEAAVLILQGPLTPLAWGLARLAGWGLLSTICIIVTHAEHHSWAGHRQSAAE